MVQAKAAEQCRVCTALVLATELLLLLSTAVGLCCRRLDASQTAQGLLQHRPHRALNSTGTYVHVVCLQASAAYPRGLPACALSTHLCMLNVRLVLVAVDQQRTAPLHKQHQHISCTAQPTLLGTCCPGT